MPLWQSPGIIDGSMYLKKQRLIKQRGNMTILPSIIKLSSIKGKV